MDARGGLAEHHVESLSVSEVRKRFEDVRRTTLELCAPLDPADCEPQSMPECSPTKWHLAHTTWFFEVFVLEPFEERYRPYDPAYRVLFNSYYQRVGPRQLRSERGLLTRPRLSEVFRYRQQVEERVLALLAARGDELDLLRRVELGCHHEQQHQELILTDIKHLFSRNLLAPAYLDEEAASDGVTSPLSFLDVPSELYVVGHAGEGFCFDNETPRHRAFLEPFRIANRLVTNGEYEEFIADGGYARAELWLDQGYSYACEQDWSGPLYWRGSPGERTEFTLEGERPLRLEQPVCHLSYYEADAFARWAGARLPTEREWEVVASGRPVDGNLLERRTFHPRRADPSTHENPIRQLFGDVWEWTRSGYDPYPGYRPLSGALGEYNGKFMCDQHVLRGGSCLTSASHIRPTYRNFFYAKDRWQFSGLRLAKDASNA